MAKNLRMYSADGTSVLSPELTEDFRAAEKTGPFRVGKTAIFYRDLSKLHYIPLGDIDHAFTRVVATSTHCCCGTFDLNTFRLVLCGNGRELAAVYTENESYVDRAQALLSERIPNLKLGYTKSAEAV